MLGWIIQETLRRNACSSNNVNDGYRRSADERLVQLGTDYRGETIYYRDQRTNYTTRMPLQRKMVGAEFSPPNG